MGDCQKLQVLILMVCLNPLISRQIKKRRVRSLLVVHHSRLECQGCGYYVTTTIQLGSKLMFAIVVQDPERFLKNKV